MPGRRSFFLPRFRRKSQKRGAATAASGDAESPPSKRSGSGSSSGAKAGGSPDPPGGTAGGGDSASSHAFAATFAAIAKRASTGAEKLLPASHGMGRTVHFFHRGARDGMRHGGYFTAHGAAASAIASLFGENLHRNASSGLASVNLNHKLLRRVLRSLLLRKRCKVEIWTSGAPTAAASSSSSSSSSSSPASATNASVPVVVGHWMLSKRASPASFHSVRDLLFHVPGDGGGGGGSGGGLDQSVFAAEAASCMSLAVRNARLDCGCTCAELRVAVANEAREFVGVYRANIHWNTAEVYRNLGMLTTHYDVRECVVPDAPMWATSSAAAAVGAGSVGRSPAPSTGAQALARIGLEAAAQLELHHVVVTAVPSRWFGSDGSEARSLLAHVTVDDADGGDEAEEEGGEGGGMEAGDGGSLVARLRDPRTAGGVCALLRYLRVHASSSPSSGGGGGGSGGGGGGGSGASASTSSSTSPSDAPGPGTTFQLRRISWDAYMRLNEDVLRTLSVFESDSGSGGGDGTGAAAMAEAAGGGGAATGRRRWNSRGNHVPKTLFALLSHGCVTTVGPPLLIGWLRKPLQSRAAIAERLNVVDFFTAHPEVLADLRRRPALQGAPNLSGLAHAFRTRKATLRSMVQVYGLCANLRHIVELLADHADTGGGGDGGRGDGNGDGGSAVAGSSGGGDSGDGGEESTSAGVVHDGDDGDGGGDGAEDAADAEEEDAALGVAKSLGVLVARLQRVLADLGSFERLVEASVDVPEFQKSGTLQISAALHPRLLELAADMKAARARVERERLAVAKQLKLEAARVKVDLAHGSGSGSVGHGQAAFRVTKTHDKHLRACNKEHAAAAKQRQRQAGRARSSASSKVPPLFTVLSRQSAGVYFVSDALVTIGKALRTSALEYHSIQVELQRKAVEVAATFVPVLVDAGAALAQLDVLQSFAHLSISGTEPYARPAVTSWGAPLVLEGSRHPLLEVQDGVECIRNDARMAPADGRLQIITGPNMGGKSTFIRQVAVCVLLAHVGCHVPCTAATIPLVDGIYSRVGSADDSQNGVSTFMAEMLAAQTILAEATPRSLVIVDEIGRGTCVADGCGLAWAIASHIARDIRCYCYFATHFHELTRLADDSDGTRQAFVPRASAVAAGGGGGRGRAAAAAVTLTASSGSGGDDGSSGGKIIRNLHMRSHTTADTITMLYEVRPGVCSDSLGLHCARMAGFPAQVLAEAARWKADRVAGAAAAAPAAGAGAGAPPVAE